MLDPAAIALGFVALHLIGDFVTQTPWMAANKMTRHDDEAGPPCEDCGLRSRCPDWRDRRRWAAAVVRTGHVATYSLPFIPLGLLGGLSFPAALLLGAAVFVPHWLIDCRRWASPEPWPAKPIMVDQSLHAAHLAIVFAAFFGGV